MWTNIQTSYKSLKFFDNFDTFITNHIFLEVSFIRIQTHKNYHYDFLLKFLNCLYNLKLSFSLCISLKKPTTFMQAVMTKPVCSKRPWVGINTMYSFDCWLFFLAPCRSFRVLQSSNSLSDSELLEEMSSNVNEGIRAILNLFIFFFTRRFHTHKKHKRHKKYKKHKKHKTQTRDFPPLRCFLCTWKA